MKLRGSRKNELIFLAIYHQLFCIAAYYYRVNRGSSDAHTYWGLNHDLLSKPWLEYLHYGSDFILFLNYPLVWLGLPFWFGFFLYGCIGFLGIYFWVKTTYLIIDSQVWEKFKFLPVLFLWPNIHYATASLGKEPLIFFGIAYVMYQIAKNAVWHYTTFLALLLVAIIRPHVAIMLLLSWAIIALIASHYSFKKKILWALSFSGIVAVLGYMVLQLSQIKYLNWQRIQYYNDYSILSFQKSRAYVPMLEYGYGYKFFSFLYRPLFFDAHNGWMMLSSIENLVFLLLSLVVLIAALYCYQNITYPMVSKIAVWFAFISVLAFVHRYANLGIFMRTKVMFQPFLLSTFVYVLAKAIPLLPTKNKNE